MTTQAAQQTKQFSGNFTSPGYIMWFHVPDVDYDPVALAYSASQVGLMPDLSTKVKARGGSNAWEVATNIKDQASLTGVRGETRTYMTQDIPGLTWTRVLLMVTKNSRNVEISTVQVAALQFKNGVLNVGIHRDFTADNVGEAVMKEALGVIDQVRTEMSSLVDSMSAAGVRYLIRSWLMKHHRVPLKNNGGAYFIPMPNKTEDVEKLESELVTLINWITAPPLMGEFVVIPLVPTNSIFSSISFDQVKSASFIALENDAEELRLMLRDYQIKAREGKQIRPTAMMDIRSKLDEYSEKAELLSDTLQIQTNSLVAGVEILRGHFDKIWKDHGTVNGAITKDVDIFFMDKQSFDSKVEQDKNLRSGTRKNRVLEGK